MKKWPLTFPRILIVLFLWGLYLILDIIKKSVFTLDSGYIYYFYFPGFILWILLTYPLYLLFRYSAKFNIYYRFGLLLLLGFVIGISKHTLNKIIHYFLRYIFIGVEKPFLEHISTVRPFYYVEAIIVVWIIFIIFYSYELNIKFREKSIEASLLEAQLSQSKLQVLKMQLRPHFLFNAHNIITMMIRTKKYDSAIEMISGLSDLLRVSLQKDDKQFVSLKEELELLKKYLYIEEQRFEDTLEVSYKVDSKTLSCRIPALILQPIVENAFKHGFSNYIGLSKLEIKASIENDYLLISIFNNGPHLKVNYLHDRHGGVGLMNTRKRLNQLYSHRAKFKLENFNNGVLASFYIPLNE